LRSRSGGRRGSPDQINFRVDKCASLADPRIKTRLIELGGTAFPGAPSEFANFVAAETAKWGKVVKFANRKPE
jgi:tripartite-type tricarboxylate transporter receptor subunit TctC